MAEVLSPMFPHSDPNKSTHSRPSSSEAFRGHSSPSPSRMAQMPRNTFNNGFSNSGQGYRGSASQGPVAPYAFKSTPQLKHDNRARSSSHSMTSSGNALTPDAGSAANRQRYPPTSSVSTTSSSNSSAPSTNWGHQMFSKDDSVLSSSFQIAPFTTETGFGNSQEFGAGQAQSTNGDSSQRGVPDRYRRIHRKSEGSVPTLGSQAPLAAPPPQGFQKMGQFSYNVPQQPKAASQNDGRFTLSHHDKPHLDSIEIPPVPATSVTLEGPLGSRSPGADSLKRYRRRPSTGNSFDASKNHTEPQQNDGNDSTATRSTGDSTQQETRPGSAGNHRHSTSMSNGDSPASPIKTHESNKRITNPSPLSRPMSSSNDSQPSPGKSAPISNSPAVAAMAALNEKDNQKGMKSRLRRAFAFGASADAKKSSDIKEDAAAKAKARQQAFSNGLDEELDEEQRAIAQKQEAAGLGNSIYSGQGNVFTGSTDNLSISSTASSASMMLRKMGRGMKKGGKSIKGMFRPKSVIGVPPADAPLAATGQVSMVTVQAEREKVNVNINAAEQVGGGTGFPRLERNSVEMGRASGVNDDGPKDTRKTLVGGDQERQEILATVKRGILKRSTTAPTTTGVPLEDLRHDLSPPVHDRASPAPSHTSSEHRRSGHRRTDSHTLEGDDYFATLPRLPGANVSSRSLPDGSRISRNISFSPRIQFHDVWSASDYDRRGDIATCNRLTPMLAQQIKEELNTFKMEMEVHEMSKPYTHFF